jgi:phage replication-related protein YjqB (UPF0714/DUF867 family)
MARTYVNFADLAGNEVEGESFRVLFKEGCSDIVIITPHTGKIEA